MNSDNKKLKSDSNMYVDLEYENRRLRSELIIMTRLCEDILSSRKNLSSEATEKALQKKINDIQCDSYTSHLKIFLELVKKKFDNNQLDDNFINNIASILEEIGFIDSAWYLNYYKDVAEAGYSAGYHYILWGQYEKRIVSQILFDEMNE